MLQPLPDEEAQMIRDIGTVAWKELRELLFPDGRLQGGAKNILVFIGISGLLFPLQSGPAWFTSWRSVFASCFPIMLALNYAADAFAGERERHTLETLLATRLDGRAILFGKILAGVLYAWSVVVACQPVSVLALNLRHRGDGFLFYQPTILTSILGMSLLLALLLGSAGALVSLTAPTARVAAQRMLIPFVAVLALPGAIRYVAVKLHWQPAIQVTPETVIAAIAAACVAAIALCLAIAVKLFTRERAVLA